MRICAIAAIAAGTAGSAFAGPTHAQPGREITGRTVDIASFYLDVAEGLSTGPLLEASDRGQARASALFAHGASGPDLGWEAAPTTGGQIDLGAAVRARSPFAESGLGGDGGSMRGGDDTGDTGWHDGDSGMRVVPLPGAAAMAGLGLAGMAARRRRD